MKILPTCSIMGSYLKPNASLCLVSQELNNLRIKESGHVSLYIAEFRTLMSRTGDWGDRDFMHHYSRVLESRILDQLTSYTGSFDTIQELMEFTLKLDTRYHERQKKKGSHQEKNPPVSGSNFSRPPQDSSSKSTHHMKNRKDNQFQVSNDKPHSALLNKEKKLIGCEKERRINKGYVLIVVERNQLKNSSRDLRASLGHQQASLESRENTEL
ncbi:hypothetical protein O181_014578 [Austropuccinia psidii MF-1]|uniref:Retrotransposon gag domain-containing protein n=1 Tax=Austropuccinia psidii MF-1 TaxID=1389203 RepID=A0A9Q3GP59_9BASI|nr:hypothetical protein [Austropuccinia psidii MF-1]